MAKKKEMNRTSGTARRKISQAEQVRYGMKTGAPLTGSASGVKSISLKQAGEALTQGIVTVRGGKLKFAPEGLAMALPFGKVFNAAKALRGAGKIAQATALEARLGAKVAGMQRAGNLAERSGRTPVSELSKRTFDMGRRARKTSESVFPRAAGAVGESSREITARLGRQSNLPMGLKRELSQAVKQTGTGFTKFSKGAAKEKVRTGTSKDFGRAAAKEVAKNSKTPKMTAQQAQDSYERVSDLIKGGRAAKRRGR